MFRGEPGRGSREAPVSYQDALTATQQWQSAAWLQGSLSCLASSHIPTPRRRSNPKPEAQPPPSDPARHFAPTSEPKSLGVFSACAIANRSGRRVGARSSHAQKQPRHIWEGRCPDSPADRDDVDETETPAHAKDAEQPFQVWCPSRGQETFAGFGQGRSQRRRRVLLVFLVILYRGRGDHRILRKRIHESLDELVSVVERRIILEMRSDVSQDFLSRP